jgi:hypothetical protein
MTKAPFSAADLRRFAADAQSREEWDDVALFLEHLAEVEPTEETRREAVVAAIRGGDLQRADRMLSRWEGLLGREAAKVITHELLAWRGSFA